MVTYYLGTAVLGMRRIPDRIMYRLGRLLTPKKVEM